MWAKEELRKENAKIRLAMTQNEVLDKSACICRNILNSDIYSICNNLLLFASIRNEVNLRLLFEQAIIDGKNVYYPKTCGDIIRFFQVEKYECLIPGRFQVPEPENEEKEFLDTEGLLIAPGLAFSKQGHRIGYGKGYYDRFLKNKNLVTVGVGYHFQFKHDFISDTFDVPLKYLYSENGREL